MADLMLSDGRVITIDLRRISHKDFLRLMKSQDDDPEQARLLGQVCGLSADEIDNLSQEDWLRLLKNIVDASRDAVLNPKSPSPSTSP